MKLHPTEKNVRLDHYLSTQLPQSRQSLKALIKTKNITVNTLPSKPSYLLQSGDTIEITLPEPAAPSLSLPPLVLDLIFEDPDLLILNKPAGLIVHAGSHSAPTVVDYLRASGLTLTTVGDPQRPGIVHRLDKNTEGLMVIAKTNIAATSLLAQFKDRQVLKKYYGMIKGNFIHPYKRFQNPIGRHPSERHKQWVCNDGKEAITDVHILKRFNTKTLLDIQIKTGRTHQIRVHLAYAGYPILGDPEYGETPNKNGQQLQAYLLSFRHPTTQQQLTFKLPLSTRFGVQYDT